MALLSGGDWAFYMGQLFVGGSHVMRLGFGAARLGVDAPPLQCLVSAANWALVLKGRRSGASCRDAPRSRRFVSETRRASF